MVHLPQSIYIDLFTCAKAPKFPWTNSDQHKVCVYDSITQILLGFFFMLRRVKGFADGVQ